MAQENQIFPLVPAKFNPRSDEEVAVIKPKTFRKEKSSKCLVYFLALIVIASTIALIFSVIVIRTRSPDAELTFVSIRNLKYSNNATSPFFSFTLQAELSIKNPNFGPFKFENSTCSVLYKDRTVGESRLGQGRVAARETETIKVVLDVKSYRLHDNQSFDSDIKSGILKLSSRARFNGRIHLLKTIKKKRMAFLNCTMNVNLTSQAIQDLVCD
ncbi:hypothetical protein JCGZ_20526 [Jatropha curcas]|uniref:Late embryogenesis abundant protein LEA-2 subgroup domain-containing protein n=1 Tax=Jatropha curcas TaxID=180498 RepID=A0A067JZD4_JATCU|nr:late embryogenesis abundant protein At1g64065 [Jatropha curcas]KDP25370.1 hypothetical protein JCGZ_20526 [Jatropha curcas]